jgi:UDPglucose--hexose-1-phosphate uridylyltransferase
MAGPLFYDLNIAEKKYKKRVVFENRNFIAYIPYFTDYPFGVFIVNKKLKGNITEFNTAEKKDLMQAIKKITAAFDKVFERQFPYMMCMHPKLRSMKPDMTMRPITILSI